MSTYPRAVVFDLDYTLWPCWCDTHIAPPIKSTNGHQSVIDKYGYDVGFYPDVPELLKELADHPEVQIFAASRTHAPKVATKMLDLLFVDNKPSHQLFQQTVWGVGSKIKHFREIEKLSGIEFEDMLFFDDEARNRDVETLGVTFVLVDNGLTRKAFDEGLDKWRQNKTNKTKSGR